MSPHVWLLAHNLSNAAILGTGTLGIVIWIGVAVLLLALLILMRTRWGQSQPLSKCVVLSVFAHLLLFLYAHGTRLLDGRPTLGSDAPFTWPSSPPLPNRMKAPRCRNRPRNVG